MSTSNLRPMSNKPTCIASFPAGQVERQDLQVHLGIKRLTLLVETHALDGPGTYEQHRFVFGGVVAFESRALAAPATWAQHGIYEYTATEEGMRHFSFFQHEGRAEMHIYAAEFTANTD